MFANGGEYRELGKASVNKRKRKVLSSGLIFGGSGVLFLA